MREITTINTEPNHLRILSNTMRPADRAEIEKFGWSVNKGLWRSYKGSLICKSIFVEGELAAIFGIGGGAMSDIGTPWLITTYACEKVSPLAFARTFQKEVLKMLQLFPVLANFVDASYDKAVKLLENCGFTIGEPEELGGHGELYRKFSIKRRKA